MEYVLSSAEMKNIDEKTSSFYNIDSFTLMERAALESAKVIEKEFGNCKVAIFAGIGNNGGDGVALARILWELGYTPRLFIIGDLNKASQLTLKQIDILKKYPVEICYEIPKSLDCDCVVDSLFGIGLNRTVAGKYYEAIEFINSLNSKKISLDIPSGINADNGNVEGIAVNADITITFGAKKIGQILFPGRKFCGKLICVKIGIPVELFGEFSTSIYNETDKLFPARITDGNKGTFGKVLLISGSKDMAGATILAAKAILRSGAGMLKILTANENINLILHELPEAMVEAYDYDCDLIKAFEWCDVCLIGPGLSMQNTAINIVENTLSKINKPIIIDADALNIISKKEELLIELSKKNIPVILTPHLGEFSRLTKLSINEIKSDLFNICKAFANRYNLILVCKDACTLVTDGNRVFLNTTGNDGMATAGSGDVLGGIISSFLAQSNDGFNSAKSGVFVHGLAGDIAKEKTSAYYIIAEDIIFALSEIGKHKN